MRHTTVLELVEESCRRLGEKCAVTDPQESLSYAALWDKLSRIGAGLLRKAPGRRPVMIFAEKSPLMLCAMLGVMASGRAYVPMDPKTPQERLDSILATLGDCPVLTTAAEEPLLRQAGYAGEVLLAEELERLGGCPERAALLEAAAAAQLDTDLAYILFTSGSTGVPKGVAVMHRSLVDYVENAGPAVGIREEDTVGNQTPFYADMSLKDIYMTLAAGGTLCLIPQKYFMTPKKLLQYLQDKGVSFIAWVPTAYRIVAQFDGLGKLRPDKLCRFVFSGESMPIPVYRYWRSHYPEGRYVQLYGPTEITGACCWFEAKRDYGPEETIPIGRPFRNSGMALIGEDGRIIPDTEADAPGEIVVYGSCLAAGYYRNPEKTEEAFVPNLVEPDYATLMYRTGDLAKWDRDRELVFISRKDYQIKHNGRRIELGEIEAAVLSVPGVQAACCVQDRRKDEIVLFYIGSPAEKELMRALETKLPRYMIPTAYHKEDSLPQLVSGKLDRKGLDRRANEGA